MAQPGIVLAAVGIELAGALLVGLKRHQDPLECQILIAKDVLAECRPHLGGVAGMLYFGDHGAHVRIGHLEGREQGQASLIVNRLGASIPGASPGRSLINAVIPLIVEVMLGKRRHILPICERRHRAYARAPAIRAAALYRQIIRRSERAPWGVTGHAGNPAGSRQGGIEEQCAAERRQCRGRGQSLERIRIERGGVGAARRRRRKRQHKRKRERERGSRLRRGSDQWTELPLSRKSAALNNCATSTASNT